MGINWVFLLFQAMGGEGAIPVGTAYAVWGAIGAIGTVIAGIVLFNEPVTFWRMFFLSTLVVSVVGLQVAGEVLSEALLTCAAANGGCAWSFGPVTTYARRLPHPAPRGMASPMPAAPVGTLTPARDWDAYT